MPLVFNLHTVELQECLKDVYMILPGNTFTVTVSCPEKVLNKYYRMNGEVKE